MTKVGISLSENALTTLKERYLLRDEQGNVVETPEELFTRVAKAVSDVEKEEVRTYWFDRFHEIITPKVGQRGADFLANTPTLMNADLPNGQLSACFVLPIEDSIDGIFLTLRDAAKIHQSGGGTGFSFSRLRQKDAQVDSKQGVASGPISFASVYDQATEIMKQGGKRKGANMMNLRVDHPDILEFIDMKLDQGCPTCGRRGVMTNFNVSVTVTNEFMEAYELDKMYSLYDPRTGEYAGQLSAVDVMDKIAKNAWKSAEPGIIFIDRVNERSPYEEEIEATNPCGEQPLPPYGACNLGSINLSNFAIPAKTSICGGLREYVPADVDWDRLAEVVAASTRFLDNVIDANHYPHPEIDKHAKKYRNIGLGVMGYADMLLKMGIRYGSPASIRLGDEIQEFINTCSHKYSILLAEEKGLPEAAPFKTFFEYSSPNRRNATLTTVAPTGSLCILAWCSSSIEPNFAFEYEKHVMDQILTEYHPIYKQAKDEGWYNEGVFVDAHAVDPVAHVDMQAAFQRHCDSGISKTINLPKTATEDDVKEAYIRAWQTGCKGITVYRDGSREGVLHKLETEEDDTTEPLIQDDICECGGTMVNEAGCSSCKSCGYSKCLIA